MLPILRMISVGGVIFAITILTLALVPLGGSHMQFASVRVPARGVLLARSEHPEWRQFLIQAAVRRADELSRLRDLPDTPVRIESMPDEAQEAPKVVNLPDDRIDADPDDETGSINVAPGLTIPLEIGEPSSTELPVVAPEENPPVVRVPNTRIPETGTPEAKLEDKLEDKRPVAKTPERVKPVHESRRKSTRRRGATSPTSTDPHRRGATASAPTELPIPFNLFSAFFKSLQGPPPSTADQKPTKTATGR